MHGLSYKHNHGFLSIISGGFTLFSVLTQTESLRVRYILNQRQYSPLVSSHYIGSSCEMFIFL
jgi:hypothetical protein